METGSWAAEMASALLKTVGRAIEPLICDSRNSSYRPAVEYPNRLHNFAVRVFSGRECSCRRQSLAEPFTHARKGGADRPGSERCHRRNGAACVQALSHSLAKTAG